MKEFGTISLWLAYTTRYPRPYGAREKDGQTFVKLNYPEYIPSVNITLVLYVNTWFVNKLQGKSSVALVSLLFAAGWPGSSHSSEY